MPKLQSYKTLIAKPISIETAEGKKVAEAKHSAIIKLVNEVLSDKETILEILDLYPKTNEKTSTEAKEGRTRRINAVLEKAGLKTDEDKQKYQDALAYSSSGYTIVME